MNKVPRRNKGGACDQAPSFVMSCCRFPADIPSEWMYQMAAPLPGQRERGRIKSTMRFTPEREIRPRYQAI